MIPLLVLSSSTACYFSDKSDKSDKIAWLFLFFILTVLTHFLSKCKIIGTATSCPAATTILEINYCTKKQNKPQCGCWSLFLYDYKTDPLRLSSPPQ